MQKKHLCLPILLLQPFHSQASSPFKFMHSMMKEMEESFSRMQQIMDEAYTHSSKRLNKAVDKEAFGLEIQEESDHILLRVKDVSEGTVDAHFEENMLHIKHPQVTMHIRQIKNRYNSMVLSVALESKQSDAQENDKGSFKQTSYSSYTQTIPLERAVTVEEPEIVYDEDTKELTVTLGYKKQKTIPVTVKKAH